MPNEHFDVLIVGAGLSGIGAAYRLQTLCPGKRYAVLEARETLGGTWDLFRYPGIRSDSDMFTLGYPFRPWRAARAIADGAAILEYIQDTAKEFGIDAHIRFSHRVEAASWSSAESRWTVRVRRAGQDAVQNLSCSFLYICSGYYDYSNGHSPTFPGMEEFGGRTIHAQHWPRDYSYRDKRVVIIGSGATAITLVPAMSAEAAHVTMLQRSPSYVASLPARDAVADLLRRHLPEGFAHRLARWKNALIGLAFYQLCRRAPRFASRLLQDRVARQLPAGYDVERHFRPRYAPWDQRLCLVPNGDLFKTLRAGKASIVTDEIDRFIPAGLRLKSGQELPADLVVLATGLKLQACGGMRLEVDGRPVQLGDTLAYRGVLLSGLPNMAFCVGYTNASWTLRADLSSIYVCHLLQYMDDNKLVACVPRLGEGSTEARPLLELTSAYVRRAGADLPKQGTVRPWRLMQNYLIDWVDFRFRGVRESSLHFFASARLIRLSQTLRHDAELARRPVARAA